MTAKQKKLTVAMIVPQADVQGGIAAVVNGYRGSRLEQDCCIEYIESYRDGSAMDKLRKGLKSYAQFRALLRRHRPDVVHIHSSFGPSFYRKMPFILMSKRAKIPVINHIHGAEFGPFYADASRAKRWLVRRIYGKCDHFLVLSGEWAERIGQIVPRERITILENYSIQAVEEPTKESGSSHQILFLGEIGRRKGGYDMPEILRLVKGKVPDVHLLMAGAGDQEGVTRLLTEKGCREAAKFPGWLRGKDKDKALRESAVFLLPSYDEGMPMSVLDAMGYGLPIVSTNVGGIPQLVKEGVNGYLCAPGDTKAMAKALILLLTEKERRYQAGMESLRMVRERFGLSHHLDLLEQVYRETADNNTQA